MLIRLEQRGFIRRIPGKARAIQIIRQDYVDEKKVSYESLTRAALKGMLGSLDPHSQYMEPTNFEDMKEDTESRFGGLGVHVAERNGDLIVVSPRTSELSRSPPAFCSDQSASPVSICQCPAGTVQVGTGSTVGSLPAQPGGVLLTNNGTLVFNHSDDVTFGSQMTGSGGLQQIAGYG